MNRTKERADAPEERPVAGDYYVVVAQYATFYVDADTARRMGRTLDRRWLRPWMKFTDVAGSRVWLRTRSIESIYESTPAQRERDRDFQRGRMLEERADRRPWEED